MRKKRFSADRITVILDSLRHRLQGVTDPLTELKIFTEGRRVAVQLDGGKMDSLSGQLLLDFDQAEIRRLLEFPSHRAEFTIAQKLAQQQAEAETWFTRGVEMEQKENGASFAIKAYEKALEIDPDLAGALVNLGTLYFNQQNWERCEFYYRRAVQVRPDYPLAHFNLGNLFDEQGDWENALKHYESALQLDPDYADAHYNLALLYQSHGEPLKSIRHWRIYIKLDPHGEWTVIARRELSRLRQQTVVSGARR